MQTLLLMFTSKTHTLRTQTFHKTYKIYNNPPYTLHFQTLMCLIMTVWLLHIVTCLVTMYLENYIIIREKRRLEAHCQLAKIGVYEDHVTLRSLAHAGGLLAYLIQKEASIAPVSTSVPASENTIEIQLYGITWMSQKWTGRIHNKNRVLHGISRPLISISYDCLMNYGKVCQIWILLKRGVKIIRGAPGFNLQCTCVYG